MKNFFIMTLGIVSFLNTSTWAMEEEVRHPQVLLPGKIHRFHAACYQPPGIELTIWDMESLYLDYLVVREGKTRGPFHKPTPAPVLSLKGNPNEEEWRNELVKYIQLEDRSLGMREWVWDQVTAVLSFFTADMVRRAREPNLIAKYSDLKALDLSNTQLKKRNPALLQGILNADFTPHLHTLTLSYNKLDTSWMKNNLERALHPLLKNLDLSHNKLRVTEEEPWINLCHGFRGLEKLNLSHNHIEEEAIYTLRFIFGKPERFQGPRPPANLKELNLDGNPIAEGRPDLGNKILAASKPSFG